MKKTNGMNTVKFRQQHLMQLEKAWAMAMEQVEQAQQLQKK